VVSGSARGIGREVARQLAELGHHVIVTARDPQNAKQAAGELSDGGRLSLQAEQLDVTDSASVERLRARLEADPGRLDVLVNNAAPRLPALEGGAERAHPDPLQRGGECRDPRQFDVSRMGAHRHGRPLGPALS
jgi:NAD(P)-dependent dehydrogenase (short-subunit alcohol dehydrogenase family)